MASEGLIDYGVLDPETTEVIQAPGSFHVLLRGQAGGKGNWPYPPEVVQRRNNATHAELAVTIRVNPKRVRRTKWEQPLLAELGPQMPFAYTLRALKQAGVRVSELELVLIKMRRPAAPQGVEWNAPGGVVDLRENHKKGMLREFAEEAKGMRVLGASILYPCVQFSSGVYRETYGISAVLAIGDPQISSQEGALGWMSIGCQRAVAICMDCNDVPRSHTDYCGVDGKIIMTLPTINAVIRETFHS